MPRSSKLRCTGRRTERRSAEQAFASGRRRARGRRFGRHATAIGTLDPWPSATAAPPAATSPASTSTVTRRTRAFHHYTVGGELAVEDEEVLSEDVDAVECRWCGPSGVVEQIDPDEVASAGDQERAQG